MKWYEIILIFIVLLGAANTAYQVFKITELDARSRGLKHPKLMGFIATGGQNSSGLILYLLGRRKYPSTMSNQDREIIDSRKKKVGAGLVFIIGGAIGLIISTILI